MKTLQAYKTQLHYMSFLLKSKFKFQSGQKHPAHKPSFLSEFLQKWTITEPDG